MSASQAANMTMNVGTSCYMAPELVSNEFYDEKCDVFSFAIIMYEVLTENFKPYGDASMYVETKVAKNPLFRPVLPDNFEVKPDQLPFIEIMTRFVVLMFVNYFFFVRCWNHVPSTRFSFAEIVDQLTKMKEKNVS